MSTIPYWLLVTLVVLAGCFGGFINALIVGRGRLRQPELLNLPDNKGTVYDLGFIGNIIIGSTAAFVVWATGLGNPNPPHVYAIAIISGLSGARILNDYQEKRTLTAVRDYLAKELGEAIEDDMED